ncbi:unnamed protein product [Dovyalis caffra]|uniref:Uncharacterized protein n=1 Tax=Dovyalis caffra TaxID=77055 RepID=A0AAV1RRV2_9ROSI|nr:unnamed protein product [Dovyalis caffra]
MPELYLIRTGQQKTTEAYDIDIGQVGQANKQIHLVAVKVGLRVPSLDPRALFLYSLGLSPLTCGLFLIGEGGTYKSLSRDDEHLGSENFLLTYIYAKDLPMLKSRSANPNLKLPRLDLVPYGSSHFNACFSNP